MIGSPGNAENSDYQRPDRRWLCGRDAASCALGPGAEGGCRGVSECRPEKHQDRWYCNRAPQRGETCQPGPHTDGRCGLQQPPCVPRSSSDGLRRQVLTLVLAMSLGLAILGLGSGWW